MKADAATLTGTALERGNKRTNSVAKKQQNPADLAKSASKLAELKARILFLIGALIVFRVGTFIPVPAFDPAALKTSSTSSPSGQRCWTSSTCSRAARCRVRHVRARHHAVHLVIDHHADGEPDRAEPAAARKEGEQGRRQIIKYTRWGTVALASFQSVAAASWLQSQGTLVVNPGPSFLITACITLVTGTMFLMWLGEQITERGIGNGISMIILASIVAGIPGRSVRRHEMVSTGEMSPADGDHSCSSAVSLQSYLRGLHGACAAPHHGELRATPTGTQDDGGAEYASAVQDQHVGRDPADFRLEHPDVPGDDCTVLRFSRLTIPRRSDSLQTIGANLGPGQPVYVLLYAALIIFFCFFYTALMYNSKDTADQLKREQVRSCRVSVRVRRPRTTSTAY